MERYEAQMRRALALAERGWGRVSPNPMVGAVVLDRAGDVVGEGWHEGPGTAHAEVMALRAAGGRASGGAVVATLEPCNHTGRTGACTAALLEAGVARLVAATTDVNPVVDGGGFEVLRRAGVDVVIGPLAEEARRLNVAFERHVTTGRPFVVLKTAITLDGKIAAADGSSRWISAEGSRADAQRLRAWADAIVVGAGTALADDPQLTLRGEEAEGARPPLRVVVDGAGRVPATGRVFDGSAPTLVATSDRVEERHLAGWQAAGAEVVVLDGDPAGGVSLDGLLEALGKRDVQGVLVEGGSALAWSLVRDGLLDRMVAYVAPTLVGGDSAPGPVGGAGFRPISAALPMRFTSVRRVGPDLRVEADVQRDR